MSLEGFSWVILRSVRFLFQGQAWNLSWVTGQGASPSLAFRSSRLSCLVEGWSLSQCFWPFGLQGHPWPPHKQLLQRLKASLLRSPYKSSDPLLSTLPANQGPNGCVQACTHACPPPPTCQLVSRSLITTSEPKIGRGSEDMEAVPGSQGELSALGPLLLYQLSRALGVHLR